MNSHEKSQSAVIPMAQSLTGDAVADAAPTPAPLLGAGGRTISEAIVTRLVATFDGACILGTGFAAMHWRSAAIDWHLEALVVLLGLAARIVPLPVSELGLVIAVLFGCAAVVVTGQLARELSPDSAAPARWLAATAAGLVYWSFGGLETSMAAFIYGAYAVVLARAVVSPLTLALTTVAAIFSLARRCSSSATQPLPRAMPYSAERLSPSTSTVAGALAAVVFLAGAAFALGLALAALALAAAFFVLALLAGVLLTGVSSLRRLYPVRKARATAGPGFRRGGL